MQKGFTLIELLLTIGLFVFVIGISVPIISSWQTTNNLEVALNITTSSLYRSQLLAQTMYKDLNWGIRLNPSELVIFGGDDYLTRDQTWDEKYILTGAFDYSTGLDEIVFTKGSGLPVIGGQIIIIEQNSQDFASISINSKGFINY